MKVKVSDVLQQYNFYHEMVFYPFDVNGYIDTTDKRRMENLQEWAKDCELAYLDKIFYGGEEEFDEEEEE